MITLKQVLDCKDKIIELAQLFGFSKDVKMNYELPDKNGNFKLTLIVKKEASEEVSLDSHGWLSSKLSVELNCDVNVIVYERINELYRHDYDRKSASLNDVNAIFNLFKQVPQEDIRFIDVSNDEEDKIMLEISLKQANEYLQKKLKKNTPDVSIETYTRNSL